ncbi:MAG: hypothetical protein HVN34_11045 [Methanobacteriaceae archaeon]|nr:hypothetical protein [Methanobacteriaceae archaeon]
MVGKVQKQVVKHLKLGVLNNTLKRRRRMLRFLESFILLKNCIKARK